MTPAIIEAIVTLAKALGLTVMELAQGKAILISRIEPIGDDLDEIRSEAEKLLAERFPQDDPE